MISAHDVSFRYDRALVLGGVTLTAESGEVLGLIGPNGSGKTTLLRTLYGILRPSDGDVTIDATPLHTLSPRATAEQIAVVVQESASDLPFTVADVVLLGRTPHLRPFQRHREHDRRVAADALVRVGARHLAGRIFAGLSGGERQRVLIAKALAQQATHLLLDEPTNHLDVRFQHEILQLVRSLETTTIVVLHDLNLAARYCDRLVLLDRGTVAAAGTPDHVLTPEIIEPVYGIGTERLATADGTVQLFFNLAHHP